jgi:H+/Cl- antiporter ClcA
LNPRSFFHVLTATTIAFVISKLLPVPHLELPHFEYSELHGTVRSIATLALSPIFFALLVRAFFGTTHFFKWGLQQISPRAEVRGFLGGMLLLVLFKLFPLDLYQGLGIEGIVESFTTPSPAWTPILKLLLTAITLASGFKGGEFVPLFFIGASAGSALQGFAGLHPTLLASLGCVSLFGGAAKTPITCILLAIELFGLPIAPFALFAVVATWGLSGKKTLY